METNDLPFISLPEAVRLLAVSTRTIRRLIDHGTFSAVRIGASLAIPVDTLPEPLRASRHGGPLLTLHDAAARLRVAPQQLRALARAGLLCPVRVGGSLRWLPAEIDAWQKKQAQAVAP